MSTVVTGRAKLQLQGATLKDERGQALEWGRGEEAVIAPFCLHSAFAQQARRTPDATAVIATDGQYSYRDLDERSNQLARYLQDRGVGPGVLVGIALERSLDMAVAILGTLKSGGAYVPLDPSYPSDRIAYMVKDAMLKVVLTQERFSAALPAEIQHLLCLDRDWDDVESLSAFPAEERARPDDVAYCIYTSGSTGMPKGTLISHSAIGNTLKWLVDYLHLNADDRVISIASFSFDASVWEFWPALFVGAASVLSSPSASRNLGMLYREISENRVTIMTIVPSLLAILLERPDRDALSSLRHVFSAGEALPSHVKDRFFQFCEARLDNAYGPTETAICATCGPCRADDTSANVSIGKPIRNVSIYILDEAMTPVAAGAIGEIYIGGPGLAKGYLGRPELTAERFVRNPFDAASDRLYRTGDLARWLEDGSIEYAGRTDGQVKVNGIRIETGEVEAALAALEPVTSAAVAIQHGVSDQLIGYVVADPQLLKSTLAETEVAANANKSSLFYDLYERNPTAPSFAGWNDSYMGAALPLDAMEDWRKGIVDRVLALSPRRVLELGCGSGLMLEKIAPAVEFYRGTDISPSAIADLSAWTAGQPQLANTSLTAQQAADFTGIESNAYDVVLLNSVIQYFPDIAYLKTVLEGARKALRPGGRIFVGDVRSAPLLNLFHTSIQYVRAAPDVRMEQLSNRVAQAAAQDDELVVDPQFFQTWACAEGFVTADIQLKEAAFANELSRYRYDVVLSLAEQECKPLVDSLTWKAGMIDCRSVDQLLATQRPPHLRIVGISNRRLSHDLAIHAQMTSNPNATIAEVRAMLEAKEVYGEDPNIYWKMARQAGYEAIVSWAENETSGRFDVLLRDRKIVAARKPAHRSTTRASNVTELDWEIYGNNPALGRLKRQLPAWVKSRLQMSLPQHMVPVRIVVLDKMPLTPNGKLDRSNLSQRVVVNLGKEPDGVAPMTPVEAKLTQLMAGILQVETVRPDDNFFDLGGHSLLVLKFVAAIENTFGQAIASAAVFNTPTARGLAAVIGKEAKSPTSWKHLVPMNTTTIGPPLFCLHGFDGTADDYLNLARHLEGKMPVYGIRVGTQAEQTVLQGAIADLNQSFVEEIRLLQPAGPYHICGYSFGGVPAFDVARRLEEAGEEVKLVLLDAYPLNSSLRKRLWLPRLFKMARNGEATRLFKQKLRRLLGSDLPYLFKRRDKTVVEGLFRAAWQHKYTNILSRTIIVKCVGAEEEKTLKIPADSANGWREYCRGPIDVIDIDVGHFALVKEPAVSSVAIAIANALADERGVDAFKH